MWTTLLLSAIFSCVTHLPVKAKSYCALFSPKSASGIEGKFGLDIDLGVMSIFYYLDLTHFQSSCDISQGLSYHLHSYWNNKSVDSSASLFCGTRFTGGQYDPNLACSPNSEEANRLCPQIDRSIAKSYKYSCNPSTYGSGNYFRCGVGDLSGKHGFAFPNPLKPSTFGLNQTIIDNQPPYVFDFSRGNGSLSPWASVVFRCRNGNRRLFCARFVEQSTSCTSPSEFYEDVVSSDDISWNFLNWDKASREIFGALVALTLGLFVSTITLRVFFVWSRYQLTAVPQSDMEDFVT